MKAKEKETEVVFAGADCSLKEGKCNLWWISTIKGVPVECVTEVKIEDLPPEIRIFGASDVAELELHLTEMFSKSTLKIKGCACPAE